MYGAATLGEVVALFLRCATLELPSECRVRRSSGSRAIVARFLYTLPICALVVTLTTGCDRGSNSKPRGGSVRPNVVVITVDTLRADRLGCYGYGPARTPHTDKLADEGVRVAHAIAPTPITLPSHTTIFTGLEPPAHGVRENASFEVPDEAVTLAERLKAEGYRTQAFISAIVLHRTYNLDQGFDGYDDRLWGSDPESIFMMRERSAEETMNGVLDWLDASSSNEEPFFLWLHLFDPHAPYAPPSQDAAKTPTPYDGEIAAVDRQIGRLVRALEDKGALDDTILVFTSDHGESLGDHGEATHAVFIYESTVRVPLIVRYPRKLPRGKVYEGSARSVDIMPTVLSLAEIAPGKSQGRDLTAAFAGTEPPPELVQYSESLHPKLEYGMAPLRGVREGKWTYIRAPRPELYDRSEDPEEVRNLLEPSTTGSRTTIGVARAEALRLDNQLTRALSEIDQLAIVPKAKPVDATTTEMLRALGYVADPQAKQGLQGMDPKDGIRVYAQTGEARQLFHDGDYAGCIRLVEALLATTPNNLSALNTRAMCETRIGDVEAAKKHFLRSLAIEPRQHYALVQLGRLQLSSRELANARTTFLEALDSFPSSVEAMSLMGYLSVMDGKPEEAKGWFQKGIEEDPTYAQSHIGYGDLFAVAGKYREAKEAYAKAVELEPRSFHAWFNGGLCALRLGEVETAEQYLIRAAEVDPSALMRQTNLPALQADPRLARFNAVLRTATQQ